MSDTNAAAPAAVIADSPEPEVAEGSWAKVVIVAGGRIPANVGRRKVIVIEQRAEPERDKEGHAIDQGKVKESGYPTEAHAYYRTDPAVTFPEGATVFTLSENLRPTGTAGFAVRGVRMGPGHPAFAAANLAWQKGARDIEISGASKKDQELLQPWFDDSRIPKDVKIHFA